MKSKVSESTINARLDACLEGARQGNVNQARRLHGFLDEMLTGHETDEGRLWLTEHGKLVLAEMHRQLSHCEETGNALNEQVLQAVHLKPRKERWPDTSDFVADLRIALAIANELCQQTRSGCEQDLEAAAASLAASGEYDLGAARLIEIYEAVAATVGGFKEMTRCH